jgi:hypothetical protein
VNGYLAKGKSPKANAGKPYYAHIFNLINKEKTMNTKLKVLSAAMLAGFAASASATFPVDPISSLPSGGKFPTKATRLSNPERGAFLLLEAAQQIAEGRIYMYGCAASKGTFDVSVTTDDSGAGDLALVSAASEFDASVKPGSKSATLGDKWSVSGTGAFNKVPFTGYSADGAYDLVGGVMTQTALYNGKSVNTNFDPLSGHVIKDFYWQSGSVDSFKVPVLWDYGLQAVDKKGYPQAKYWQWSKAWRSDNVDGHTEFHKTRIYNATGNGKCSIDVSLDGSNTFDGFDQQGTMTIK